MNLDSQGGDFGTTVTAAAASEAWDRGWYWCVGLGARAWHVAELRWLRGEVGGAVVQLPVALLACRGFRGGTHVWHGPRRAPERWPGSSVCEHCADTLSRGPAGR